MNNQEKKFQEFVESIQFDDQPSQAHREKLKKQLLEAYDHEQKYGDYVEPVSLYLRKLAVAASFLIACGLLFWGIDSMFIGEQNYVARHPDKEAIEKIIEAENATGEEKKQLLAQIKDIWTMISDQDTDALVSVLETDETAYAVRRWAARYLGKFGGEDTLNVLDATIDHMGITDPENPLVIAADKIRSRLGLPKPDRTPSSSSVKNGETIEAAPGQGCRPDAD